MRSISATRALLLENDTPVGSSLPLRSTKICRAPLTKISETLASANSPSNGPMPTDSETTEATKESISTPLGSSPVLCMAWTTLFAADFTWVRRPSPSRSLLAAPWAPG